MNIRAKGRALLFVTVLGTFVVAAAAQSPRAPADLCALPCSGGGTSDNPDGYPEAGRIFYSSDYETLVLGEVSSQINTQRIWAPTFGRDQSGAWRVSPLAGVWEDSAGWATSQPPSYRNTAPDEYRRVFYSFTLFVSPDMYNNVIARGGSSSMKFLDVRQYLPNGSGPDGTNHNTRWVTFLSDYNGQLKLGLAAGGAGTVLLNDGTNTNPDLRTIVTSEFVWFSIMYDEANRIAKIWMKRPGDSGVTQILERDASDVNGPEFYQSNGRGFVLGERSIAGYWDYGGVGYVTLPSQYITLDDLVVADHWTGPVW